ncbi:MAG: arsenic transporter [Alcaligenaceae bacterium]|nr:arsenic transporter [Alcaligenaceae bacterium]
MLIAAFIFVATLTLVIWQPRGLSIGWSASMGAVAALLTGIVQLHDLVVVWSIVWNATATLIALIIITLVLDVAGTFAWLALHVARWGKGQTLRLYVLLILLGALMSAVFANDGAVLILTPLVMAMMLELRFSPAVTLAFVMAAGFISDSASLPLVISNLVNIVSADFFSVGFLEYAGVMVPVNLVAVLASVCVLLALYGRGLPARFDPALLGDPREAVRDPATFRAGWLVLIFLLTGFVLLEPVGVPVSVISGAAAAVLLAVARRGKTIDVARIIKGAPWEIVIFSLGMYLVVYGLRNQGLAGNLATVLEWLAHQGVWATALGTGLLSAFLSSVMNNLPTVLLVALSIEAASVSETARETMIYANVIGSDLGPKITPIGSLATLLWLHVLQRKGLAIGWGYYFRMGVLLTLPVLLLSLAALAWRLSL